MYLLQFQLIEWKSLLPYTIIFYLTYVIILNLYKRFKNYKFPQSAHNDSLISGNFHEFKENPEGMLLNWKQNHEDICTIRFFHKKIILLNSVEMVQKFFCGKLGSITSDRPRTYLTDLVSKGKKGILFRSYGKELEIIRNISMQFFHDTSKTVWEEEVSYKFGAIITQLRSKIQQSDKDFLVVTDMKELFEKFLVDLAGPIIFGKSMDFAKLKGEILQGILFNLKNTTMFNILTMLPIYHFVPNSLFNKMLKNQRRLQSYTLKVLDDYKKEWHERVKNGTVNEYVPNDLMNYLLKERYMNLTKGILSDDDDIMISANTIFLSFFESVSSCLIWFLFYLAKNEECQMKAREEMKEKVGSCEIKFKHRNDLNYFNACTKEALRLSSQVPIVSHLITQDAKVDELYLPKGTPVIANFYAIHLNENAFEDATKFNPDRWLNDNTKNLDRNYCPFSIGKRFCIGKFLARDLLFYIIGNLVHRFKFSLTDDIKNANETELRSFGISRVLDTFSMKIELA